MKYLFFDIECANCWQNIGKICSFGYVITDESFNLIIKKDIIINPRAKFDYRGLSIAGIKLPYTEKQYKSAPSFAECYEQIKELITSKDHIVCGHSTSSDAKYLLDECKRYNKDPFDYIYIDTIKLIKLIYKREKDLSLSVLYNEFFPDCGDMEAHKSDDDAFMTMKIAQYITLEQKLTFNQLISQNTLAKGEVFWGRIVDKDTTIFNYSAVSNKTRNSNGRIFEQAKKEQKVDKKGELLGKRYCIEHSYENNNFAQMLLIIKALNQKGGRYVSNIAFADYYVTKKKGNNEEHLPKNTKIISFSEFIKKIDLTKQELLTQNIDCDELIGSFESNKGWYTKYKNHHIMLQKIERFIEDDNFECSVDFPVIQYVCKAGDKKTYRFYDPVLNGLFTRHPYRVNRGCNSYLPNSMYQQAKNESESRVFASVKRSFSPKQVDIEIVKTYNYIVSYKFLGKFINDEIVFTVYEEIIADKSFEKSIKINREAINVDLSGALMRYYSADLLSKALKAMSKFNFGYKFGKINECESIAVERIANIALKESENAQPLELERVSENIQLLEVERVSENIQLLEVERVSENAQLLEVEKVSENIQLTKEEKAMIEDINNITLQESQSITMQEGDTLHLPKKYYEEFIKADKKMQGNIIIGNESMFIPTVCRLANNLFAEKITLPVVIERKI